MVDLELLCEVAWTARENASLNKAEGTKVGSALITEGGVIISGCNVEHPFLTATIHAEANAIGTMVNFPTYQGEKIKAIVVTSERYKFTPCGGCCDLIMHFGDENTIVAYQNEKGGPIHEFKMREIMPHYPH